MQPEMIVTDLDRTLLRSDKTISNYTRKILARCRSRGLKLVLATARPKNRVDILFLDQLADAVVTDNGAAIYLAGELAALFPIPPGLARPLLQDLLAALPGRPVAIEYPSFMQTNSTWPGLWHAPVIRGLDKLPAEAATKIVVEAGPDLLPQVKSLLPEDLYAQACENRLILIMHKTASKWQAVQELSGRFSVNTAATIAFGDDYNDRQMLEYCGTGVAVGQALPEIKAVADYICAGSDDDGVARWLAEHVLCKSPASLG